MGSKKSPRAEEKGALANGAGQGAAGGGHAAEAQGSPGCFVGPGGGAAGGGHAAEAQGSPGCFVGPRMGDAEGGREREQGMLQGGPSLFLAQQAQNLPPQPQQEDQLQQQEEQAQATALQQGVEHRGAGQAPHACIKVGQLHASTQPQASAGEGKEGRGSVDGSVQQQQQQQQGDGDVEEIGDGWYGCLLGPVEGHEAGMLSLQQAQAGEGERQVGGQGGNGWEDEWDFGLGGRDGT